jgi:ParB family chromosome partitioning protein
MTGHKPETVAEKPVEPDVKELEERLQNKLGTRVSLHHGAKGGSLTIHYYSDEELNVLVSQLLGE